ncbi:MAG: copper amine oxidase N-terminal domain-containing protein [Fimbriimonas sp.]
MIQLALLTVVSMTPQTSVYADGKQISLLNAPAPIIRDDRVQVPMRGIFEALGATVEYLPELRQVVATGDREVTLVLDENFAYVDGQHRLLDYPPRVVDGHVMVPTRFVSEALGASVRWDAARKTVTIQTNNPPQKMEE